ncbi:stage III sporulation protein AH [Halobacillus salinus]|uniref:stage III sporulation protein AH n=1 Tax=Halobacillus salinus TaxID=192814 RepID=UPI0020CA4294|nr:stage III sporulation protein AH [Halobacillus salinus]
MLMVRENIEGERYHQLLELLVKHCDRFAFVERRDMMENEETRLAYIDDWTGDIQEDLIEREIQKRWVTTTIFGATAYVFYYHFNNRTKRFLKEQSRTLFDWVSPELPEDLMFYHQDTCMLAGCSHEGYFMVDEALWNTFSSS